ncbi:MAG: TetR/AcrR family transcriptional regulator [Pseudomonadales bacterium]|nr:TetR/AcrR family transcriptional regulator [Pseudomonadales bacterium]
MVAREDWIRAALEALHEEGHMAATPNRLAHKLGLTRGSFYHHFCSLGDFIDAIMERFEYEGIIMGFEKAEQKGNDPWHQLQGMLSFAETRSYHLELALRAWGLNHARVAHHLERIDAERERRLIPVFAQLIHDPEQGRRLARLAMLAFIGRLCSFPAPKEDEFSGWLIDLKCLLPTAISC